LDSDLEKLQEISRGQIPFFERNLDSGLDKFRQNGALRFSEYQNEYAVIIICVGTPSLASGEIDLAQISVAVEYAKEILKVGGTIVIKSTVLPGTTQSFQDANPDLHFAMIPEFLREGSAVHDSLNPDRIIYGVTEESKLKTLQELLNPKGKAHEIVTTLTTAETAKYVSNSFFAMLIYFANYWDELAQINVGIDISVALNSLGIDRRLNSTDSQPIGLLSYIVPGIGFGGSCFPKDLRALSFASQAKSPNFFQMILDANKNRVEVVADRVKRKYGAIIYIVAGMSFKEGTSDTRESPGLALFQQLWGQGERIFWWDNLVEFTDPQLNNSRIDNFDDFLDENLEVCVLWTNHDPSLREFFLRQLVSRPSLRIECLRGQRLL
jgi:UDPglucose 6-dehydrogenase